MKEGVQRDDVGVIDLQQHFLLRVKVHQLVLLEYLLLAHDLEGVYFFPPAELDQLDPAEGAVAQRGQHFQVVALQFSQYLLAVLLESVELGLLHSL